MASANKSPDSLGRAVSGLKSLFGRDKNKKSKTAEGGVDSKDAGAKPAASAATTAKGSAAAGSAPQISTTAPQIDSGVNTSAEAEQPSQSPTDLGKAVDDAARKAANDNASTDEVAGAAPATSSKPATAAADADAPDTGANLSVKPEDKAANEQTKKSEQPPSHGDHPRNASISDRPVMSATSGPLDDNPIL